MSRAAAARVLLSLTCACASSSVALAQATAPANDSINKDQLRADLYFLAGDAMRGRLTDTPENRLAASFIKARFDRLGLSPGHPDGSFYQSFRLIRSALGDGNRLQLEMGDVTRDASQEVYPTRFSPSASVEGELVFVGFGIGSPGRSYDDYRGGAVRGKIALVLNHEPGESDPESVFDGVVTSESSRDLRKALYAQQAGAIGILFVSDIHNHPDAGNFDEATARYWPHPPSRIPRYTLARWAEQVRIPAAQISPALAEAFVSTSGKTLAELARSAESSTGVEPTALSGVTIRLATDVRRNVITDRNVVAAVEGGDLKDEWVIVCAHYDHNGASGDQVFNGADDDGSGTVALLEIAEAYALALEEGHRPRRSVLFAAWNSEERGLLGAWAYAEEPLAPLAKTVATLNMDMIGRNEEVRLGGGRRFRGLEQQTAQSNANAVNILGQTYSAGLKAAVEQANRPFELNLMMRYDNNPSNLLRRSDQWPFLQLGVPALFFHTGLHPDYHTEFDVAERINYDKLERIARLVHQTSWQLAMADGRPSFDKPNRIVKPLR